MQNKLGKKANPFFSKDPLLDTLHFNLCYRLASYGFVLEIILETQTPSFLK